VAIDDVLPLKTARRDVIANLKWFWGPGTPETWFRWFYLHSLCSATLFSSHQRHLPYPVWQSLAGFRLLCATPGNKAERGIYDGGWKLGSNFDLFVDQSSWNFQTM